MTNAENEICKLFFKELGGKLEQDLDGYEYNPNTAITKMENTIELSCLEWKLKLKLNPEYNIPIGDVDDFVDKVLEINAFHRLNKIIEQL